MRLLFINRPTAASHAIRALTASPWSHVACEIDGWVYEARAQTGVWRIGTVQAVVDASAVAVARVDTDDRLALRWLDAQLGKPYDWTAIWSWYGSRDWQEEDSWFCSELVAAACVAGNRRVVYAETARVTPGHVWNSPVIVRE